MLAKSETFPHTRSMSETNELPQGPDPKDLPTRLEDRPEFQALAPEQQEKLLALRERLMAEAANPENVVSRSINEMGFWEGLKHTVKPHMAKHKEIMFKELKAGASLAISLVPVLGEGKGIGTGLFGITKAKDLPWMRVSAEAFKEGKVVFEPAMRAKNAISAAKEGYATARAFSAVDNLKKVSGVTQKTPGIFKRAGARIHDSLRPVGAIFAGKGDLQHSLGQAYSESAQHGAEAMAKRLKVDKIYQVTKGKREAEKVAYTTTKAAETIKRGIQKREWYRVDKHWKALGVEVAARRAKKDAAKIGNSAINMAVEVSFKDRKINAAQRAVEGKLKKVSPALIEGTRFGQYKAFFERWLNLTPDVPVWISTTTGVAEFLGAHGIDAIPAVMQMGINRYQQLKVSKDMGLDVMGYVATRALGKLAERKRAAQVFRPQEAVATV